MNIQNMFIVTKYETISKYKTDWLVLLNIK